MHNKSSVVCSSFVLLYIIIAIQDENELAITTACTLLVATDKSLHTQIQVASCRLANSMELKHCTFKQTHSCVHNQLRKLEQ